jgi:5'-nucleotidase
MISRRRFITTAAAGSAALLAAPNLHAAASPLAADETLITILHTNDTHSQIDPLPTNDRNAGMGGVARRATLIQRVRAENPNTLLVDAGDAFQGTPYFNLYKGEAEFKAMSLLGYDAMTLGNHDFDNGVDSLAAMMKFANFGFVSANYDLRETPLASRVKPYIVRELSGVRVGVFGLGIKLEGLNAAGTFRAVRYQDPVGVSREMVQTLRGSERCALVVCLSHLGYYPEPKGDEIGDTQLAAAVDGIDFITSAHTHTFMKEPVLVRTPSGEETIVFQVGKSGINLGRVDFRVRKGAVTQRQGSVLAVEPARRFVNV